MIWDLLVGAVGGTVSVASWVTTLGLWLKRKDEKEDAAPSVILTIDGNRIEIDLEDPEQAELFIRDYLTQHETGDSGASSGGE
jgi:hypothetical protein